MNRLQEFLEQVILKAGDYEFRVANLLLILAVILAVWILRWAVNKGMRRIYDRFKLSEEDKLTTKRFLNYTISFLGILMSIRVLGFDVLELNLGVDGYEFRVLNLLLILAVILAVWILRWAVSEGMRTIYENFKLSKENKLTIKRFLNYVIWLFAALMIIRVLGIHPVNDILNFKLFDMPYGKEGEFKIANIFNIILIYILVRMLIWVIDLILDSYSEKDKVDVGTRYAINQVLSYIIYIAALLTILEVIGFQLTILWGGAAALLVGFGLGLQQTFNDLVSGLLLLIERTVEVGDTLDVDGTIGVVERIGIRVSQVRTRDDINVLVPNSMLVTAKVVNWTHNNDNTRFHVAIGVAYGSDTALVKKLLLEAVNQHKLVETYPTSFVQFTDFGASSLDFKVYFWSKEAMKIEHIKSDLRFYIDDSFRKNKIEIPFPQHDVWVRKS
jgi:small-conductance mechanosensitive channel